MTWPGWINVPDVAIWMPYRLCKMSARFSRRFGGHFRQIHGVNIPAPWPARVKSWITFQIPLITNFPNRVPLVIFDAPCAAINDFVAGLVISFTCPLVKFWKWPYEVKFIKLQCVPRQTWYIVSVIIPLSCLCRKAWDAFLNPSYIKSHSWKLFCLSILNFGSFTDFDYLS